MPTANESIDILINVNVMDIGAYGFEIKTGLVMV